MAKFTNSELATYVKISPFKNSPQNPKQRTQPITKVTIHHMAGVGSVESFGKIVTTPDRNMSATYAIGNDGRIGRYLEESDRPWTSSSKWNDQRAVTIEVSNSKVDKKDGEWPISAAAWASMIKLTADICKRNGIKKLTYTGDKNGSLTFHRFYAATGCLPVETTDVLTKKGWVALRDIKVGDVIAAVDPTTMRLKWLPVENRVNNKVDTVYSVCGMTVTSDHRVLCNTDAMSQTGYDFKSFEELDQSSYRVPAACFSTHEGLEMTSSEMVFLLQYQKIGSMTDDGKIEFRCIVDTQQAYLYGLLTNLKFKYEKIQEDLGPVCYVIDDPRANELVKEFMSGKDFTWKWIEMNPTQFSYFIYKVTSHEDGTWRRVYQSDSQTNINIVQAICAMNDRGTHYHRSRNVLTIGDPYRCITPSYSVAVDDGIDVSCVTVKTGAFMIRQNGYVTITGNCPGPYLFSRAQQICDEVNAILNPEPTPTPTPDPDPEPPKTEIKVGNLVKIASGAVYYGMTKQIPSWVTAQNWYVTGINGARVVLGKNESGATSLNSAVDAKYLTVIENAGAPVQKTFTPYTTSVRAGTTVYQITNMQAKAVSVVKTAGVYTSTEEKTIAGVKYGYLKSGIGWINLGKDNTTIDTVIRVGDKVSVVLNKTYDGKFFKVYAKSYTVLEVKGDRVVISSDGKNVTAAVKASNLKKL